MFKSASRFLQHAARASAGLYRLGSPSAGVRVVNVKPKQNRKRNKKAWKFAKPKRKKTRKFVEPKQERERAHDVWLLADLCEMYTKAGSIERLRMGSKLDVLWRRVQKIDGSRLDIWCQKRIKGIRLVMALIEKEMRE